MSDQNQALEGTIPVQEAIDITTNWRNFIEPVVQSENYIRAFHIPIDDITSLASYHNTSAVRAYLALAIPGDVTSLKLAIVPIDMNGDDMVVTGSSSVGVGRPQSAVYDFTTPCPQACDVNSPLFTGE